MDLDADLNRFLAQHPKGSPVQQEADRRLVARVRGLRARQRRQRTGEALSCLYDAMLDLDQPSRRRSVADALHRVRSSIARAVTCLEAVDVDVAAVVDRCVELQDFVATRTEPDAACVGLAVACVERLAEVMEEMGGHS